MANFYKLGAEKALSDLGIEKTAVNPLAGGLSRILGHAGMGAAIGGVGGAMSADSGHRMQGFRRGAMVGGAIGALGGAGSHLVQANPAASTLTKTPMQQLLQRGTYGTAALAGVVGLGAGSTAHQSPWEKVKSYIPGMG